ncbi:sugar ABC transporter substrate-binding protein, partial [Phytoactinopolyspora endophytica]|uniref:sugar ABC transporter substrate-binding protein n=1 Tax=Phytoactinopolyspora endophytica TaxID=1642495 RepID=UPI0013EC981B
MRQRRTPAIALVTCIAAAAALSACSADDDDTFRVVAFTAGYGTPVGKYTLDAFVERGEELGWDVTLHTSDFDYDVINTDVVNSITQGTDAVLAGFPDPRQITPLVNAAEDADVPIFSIDGGVEPNEDFVVDVTTSQQQIAELTVDTIGEAVGGLEGKEVMVIGHDPHIGIMTRSGMA